MFRGIGSLRHFVAAGVLAAAPLIAIALGGSGEVGEASSSRPAAWVRAGVGWVEFGEYRMFAGVGDLWSGWTSSELSRKNERLREKIARLREEKSRLIGVLQENARLRDLLGFKRRHPSYELAPAEVVARDTTPYFRVLTLKIESSAELRPKMPVVVAGGVVGQIHRTYGSFADVIIVSDPRSRIDAVSQRNRAHGVVKGLGHQRDYLAEIAYLRRKDEVREGDVMVTSGMGEVFPPELVIGTVEEVAERERGLFQRATLEPAVDFSRIQEVFVVTGVDD